ncbi:pentatricopeptide repeat-containing protein At1g63400 isoform X3 [Morus notabilis]|uniref:pentatricopeptide repeat-containing protein At1g63400 isoform X3 n=1 Tax=Morus notabilis TaxID=981085 RepID=UPI000CED4603|nr:pentatricopeptide repeat-containing protein At1g63400 isoform X3 [Morus notabilis]
MKTKSLTKRTPGNPSFLSLFGIFTTRFRSYASRVYSGENSVAHLEKLIQTRCKSRNLTVEEALGYFNSMIQMRPMPSIWALNQLLGSLSNMKRCSTVVYVYREIMGCDHFSPEVGTLSIVIKCLCCLDKVNLGFCVFATMIKTGLKPDARTMSTLLHGLCKEGSMVVAMDLFNRIVEEEHLCNEITYATMINGLCNVGETWKALELLKRMRRDKRVKPTVECFSPILKGLYKKGRIDEALSLFRNMINLGVVPNVVALTYMIHGLSRLGRSEDAKRLLLDMLDSGVPPNCGRWKEAIQFLENMTSYGISPNIATFNCILDAQCKEGRTTEALYLAEVMIEKGLFLAAIANNSLHDGLYHSSKSEEAKRLFDIMLPDYSMELASVNAVFKRRNLPRSLFRSIARAMTDLAMKGKVQLWHWLLRGRDAYHASLFAIG